MSIATNKQCTFILSSVLKLELVLQNKFHMYCLFSVDYFLVGSERFFSHANFGGGKGLTIHLVFVGWGKWKARKVFLWFIPWYKSAFFRSQKDLGPTKCQSYLEHGLFVVLIWVVTKQHAHEFFFLCKAGIKNLVVTCEYKDVAFYCLKFLFGQTFWQFLNS